MIRVHVVGEGVFVQELVAGSLRREPGLAVVGDSAGGDGIASDSRPDVLALCLGWREIPDVVRACQQAAPGAKVVLMLVGATPDVARDVGADAAVDAREGMAALAAAIRPVAG